MGIGKSIEVSVSLNHSNGFYYAGEQVTGVASLRNKQKKITLTNLYIEFIGEFGYKTEEKVQSYDALGHVEHYETTVQHQSPFAHICCPLIHLQGNNSEINLDRGHHFWPFQFTLPKSLPPSINSTTDSYPYVKYYINTVFVDQFYQSKKKQCRLLKIFPRLNISTETWPIHSSCGHQNDLQLEAYLPYQSVLPGEEFSLDVHLKNPKGLKLKRIEVMLIQHQQIAQNPQNTIIFHTDLPSISKLNEKDLHKTFHIPIPSGYLSPTHSSVTQSDDLLISTDIQYELKLVAKVHGLSHDIELDIPITMGTESSSEQDQYENTDCVDDPISYAAALKETEFPPNYESAVENLKLIQFVY